MRKPPDNREDSLGRLDKALDAFEAGRQKKPGPAVFGGEGSGGYRLVGQMLSGMLGGLGLGWLVDRLLHTTPWGMVCGLLIGTGLSIFATVRLASRMSAVEDAKRGPAPAVPDDDDEQA
jgi:ATP synthase protein I